MSGNNNESGNENETVNDMTLTKQVAEVQVAVVDLITTMVGESIKSKWNEFVASGFDVKAHVEAVVKELDLESGDMDDKIQEWFNENGGSELENAIDNHDFSSVVENNICWSNAADEISGYIDWGEHVRDNLDIYDIASEVRDNLDLSDSMADEIVNWVDNGCSQVDRVAVKLYDRALKEKGVANDDTVILSRDEYNRIMEVVNFIRPVAPLPKTSRDIADELVASVDPSEAMTLIQTAIVAKATADAQALVAAANGDSNESTNK